MADVPLLPGSRPRRLATVSRQTHTLTAGFSWYFLQLLALELNYLDSNCRTNSQCKSTLYVASARTAQKRSLPTVLLLLQHIAIGTDRVENIVSHFLHCCVLRSCSLATGVFAELFPSSGCLCWLHRSCLDHTCHIIIGSRKLKTYKGGITYSGITFIPTFMKIHHLAWKLLGYSDTHKPIYPYARKAD
jgi:hypothetical protein